jgi:hypothetical protein
MSITKANHLFLYRDKSLFIVTVVQNMYKYTVWQNGAFLNPFVPEFSNQCDVQETGI